MEGAALTEMALSKANGTPGTVVKKLCINTEKKPIKSLTWKAGNDIIPMLRGFSVLQSR